MYLYDENVSKQTSIAPWQRRWRNNVYEKNWKWMSNYPSITTKFHLWTYMLKMWLDRRNPLNDNDVDVITFMNKMLVNEQISSHDNKSLPLYLYDENVC